MTNTGRQEITISTILSLNKYIYSPFQLPTEIFIEINHQKIDVRSKEKIYTSWDIKKEITESHFNKICSLIFLLNIPKTYEKIVNEKEKEKKYTINDIKSEIYKTTLFQDLKEAKKKYDISSEQKYKKETTANLKFTGLLKLDNYVDNVELFWNKQKFFFDKYNIYWFWNYDKMCWEQVDEVDLMLAIDNELNFGGQSINSTIRRNYLLAFQHVGRSKKPKDYPKTWIQFKNKMFDIKNNTFFDISPDYFVCNPIPHNVGQSEETPIVDKLFVEWVGEPYKQTLYELIAYCCLADYPIHTLFCFVGGGRNGKSSLQTLISRFIGELNICSTELDLLIENRFESAKLFKKLVCTLGETNFGVLSKTSLLKKLTGGDLIGFEFKNKLPFDNHNYAKIIINTNSLPSSLDQSDGFYRRWNIINFPNEFQEGKDILNIISEVEFENLALKITKILPTLLERGNFTNQGTIEQRKKNYIMASNPLPFFIQKCCDINNEFETYIKYSDLYNAYIDFLIKTKKRKVTRKEFSEILQEEGFFSAKKCKNYESAYFIEGIKLKENYKTQIGEIMTSMTDMTLVPLYPIRKGIEGELCNISHTGHNLTPPLPPVEPILSKIDKSGSDKLFFSEKNQKSSIGNPSTKSISDGTTFENEKKLFQTLSSKSECSEKNVQGSEGVEKNFLQNSYMEKSLSDTLAKSSIGNGGLLDISPISKKKVPQETKGDILFHLSRFGENGLMAIEQLLEDFGKEAEPLIEAMLRDGDLMQPKAGFVKKL